MYHVVLDLDQGQKKRLKEVALARDQHVREFVTQLVVAAISEKPKAKQAKK